MSLGRLFRIRWWPTCLRFMLVMFLLVLACDVYISVADRGVIYRDPEAVPSGCSALVLGTSRMLSSGRPNMFYQTRMDAAGLLYRSHRVGHLILSGTATDHYNEPESMRKDLMRLGVPDSAMTLDGKGFRTLDSILRAKRVYKADRIVIISQGFHVERAVFLARAFGVDACGYAADDSEPLGWYWRVRLREVVARTCAVIEAVLNRISMNNDGPYE
jgi:SanA protein